jgi:ribosomal protein S18 acetylase RimI-like enzyme
MTDPNIRPIVTADREQWAELFLAYGVFYKSTFTPEVVDSVWGWLTDDAHELSALVAEDGDTLVGFAHLHRVADTFTAGPKFYLDDLYVRPEQRGGGIARALIAECATIARAAGAEALGWITASDNATAQRLYDQVATRTTWVTYELET